MSHRHLNAACAALLLALASADASAGWSTSVPWIQGTLMPWIQKLRDAATNAINNQLNQAGTDIANQTARSNYGIQAEINKGAIAQKNTAEAIAQYRAQDRLNTEAVVVSEKLRQPTNACATMAMSENLAKIDAKTKSASSRGSRASTQSMLAQRSNAASVLQSYDNSLKKYCTEADEKLGRGCRVSDNPNPKLAGADVQADMLFGAADNPASSTYIGGQAEAMQDYIKRVTGNLPPEALAARDPRLERTPQGKSYAELARRYAAFMSMSTYSLNSIVASHDVQP